MAPLVAGTKFYLMKSLLLTVAFIASGTIPVSSLCNGRRAHPNCNLLPRDDKCGTIRVDQRVVGGHDASFGQVPWIAILYYSLSEFGTSERISPFCGGSIINDRYVISAAHCLVDTNENLRIRLGEHNLSLVRDCLSTSAAVCPPRPKDCQVESIVIHPKYNERTNEYDIVLIRLKERVNFSWYIHPICLPTDTLFRDERLFRRKLLEVAGWGIYSQEGGVNESPDVLQTTTLPYVPRQQCERMYGRRLSCSKICAGGIGRDACMGDSGGPLMGQFSPRSTRNRYFLIGVVSFGDKFCGQNNVPGVYVNMAELTGWVLENMIK